MLFLTLISYYPLYNLFYLAYCHHCTFLILFNFSCLFMISSLKCIAFLPFQMNDFSQLIHLLDYMFFLNTLTTGNFVKVLMTFLLTFKFNLLNYMLCALICYMEFRLVISVNVSRYRV